MDFDKADNHDGWVQAMRLLGEDDELYANFSIGAKSSRMT